MKTLILNSSNVVAGSNNTIFRYTFPNGGYNYKDDFIAVQEVGIYFSAFNITNDYNNNSFSYIWIDGTTHNVVIPDGYYSIKTLNEYLQYVMIQNKHYLVNSAGDYIYLLEIIVNEPRYAVQLNEYLISTTIATTNSWVLPAGATWVLPTNPILPYFVIPNTSFKDVIGYTAGQYPAGVIAGVPPAQTQTPSFAISQSQLSSTAPQITPYSSFLMYCSLVNNRAVIPSQLIFSFTPQDVVFGGLSSYQVSELAWNKIEDGQYNEFIIEFRDQLGRQVKFQDPNTLITLITKNKFETY
jgi:hypothetical protein